jgi:RND family efflux transporter MFP subunit
MYEGISRPSRSLDMAFAVRGKVGELLVDAGQRVEPGQKLVRLDDAVQRETVNLARHRAENQTQIDSAKKTLELREEDYKLILQAEKKSSASDTDIRTRRLQRDLAEINLQSETRTAQENAISLAREEASLAQMTMTSTIAGTVLEVHKRPGESVDELSKVITVVATDPLWLDVSVPVAAAQELAIGTSAVVTWQDLPAVGQSAGTVIFKSPVGDPGSRKVVVRLEVPNPGHLPAGLHGEARFGTGGSDSSPKPVAGPGSAPAPISDADIAGLDRAGAMKEWTTRKTAASKPGVDQSVKQRLEDEASKCKARFDQTRAEVDSRRD